MARITIWRVFLGLAAGLALVGCVETGGTSGPAATAATGSGGKVRAGEEIEAPDVFQASESALWDGRPSLGGIWVASPDVEDPERVIMFNPATGKSVKGALFRRERENPGPRLQLSSDAAEALGVLAGMPTEIQVTALRKAEVVEEVAVEPEAEVAEAGPAEAAETDAAMIATAALDAVDGAAATEGAQDDAQPDPAAAAEGETEPRPKTAKEKRAEAKAAREAKKAAAAAAKAAAAAGVPAEGEAPVTPDAVTGSEIEAVPLDARKPDVAEETGAATEPAEGKAAAVSEPAEPDAGEASRTIQIASFSKEENAKRAIEALSKIGIEAKSKKIDKDGKVYWSVMASGDQALLAKIKDAGFADAYFLK